MITQRIIPRDLTPKNTRDSKEWHKDMMARYKKLSVEFENNIIPSQDKLKIDNIEEYLTFDEADVFDFFTKAKSEMDKIKKNNDIISDKIKKYETFKQDIAMFKELVKQGNEIYDNLSKNTQILDIENKLIISQNILLQHENKLNIENFEESIDEKIYELNNKFMHNNNKLSDFKKLVLKCMVNENINYNICNVCVTNKINICINPCGHTFCSVCVEKMGIKCGMCRGKIETKIKMYIENDDNDEKDEIDSLDNSEGFSGFDNQLISNAFNLTNNVFSINMD